MQHPTCAGTLLRAALAAAIALPVALPASAGTMRTRPLPLSARFAPAQIHAAGPTEAFRRLHSRAHGNKKTAHFSFPYGLAADSLGNVYVANYDANTISMIGTNLKASSQVLSQNVISPLSLAVDSTGALFVGNTGGGGTGNVVKFVGGQPVLTITQNTAFPSSIAVDEFDDLYVVANQGVAVDDAYGNTIYGPGYAGYDIDCVAIGNASLYAFINDNYLAGNGSVMLRTSGLQSITGPDSATSPVGAACGANLCWYSDSASNALFVNNGSNVDSVSLGYLPGGVALDVPHNRVFVADPLNNAVHVYDAQNLSLEKTIT